MVVTLYTCKAMLVSTSKSEQCVVMSVGHLIQVTGYGGCGEHVLFCKFFLLEKLVCVFLLNCHDHVSGPVK